VVEPCFPVGRTLDRVEDGGVVAIQHHTRCGDD
jgi:hypothetical protein